VISGIHVNICDLVDDVVQGRPVRLFECLQDLVRYSRDTKKYFPRGDVPDQGLLRYLLRHVRPGVPTDIA
jgi:hypothetical protein